MANRYWIGANTDWDDTSNWSTSSGGSGGAAVPTSSDDVYFDANSFGTTTTVSLVTGSGAAVCRDFIWDGFAQTPTFLAGFGDSLEVYGSFKLAVNMTWSASSMTLYFKGAGNHEVWTRSKTLFPFYLYMQATGTYTVMDKLGIGSNSPQRDLRFYSGTLNMNGNIMDVRSVLFYGDDVKVFNIENSTISFKGSTCNWDEEGVTNLTVLANELTNIETTYTSGQSTTLNWKGSGINFGGSINLVNTTNPETLVVTGTNNFHSIIANGPSKTLKFESGTTTSVISFQVEGSDGNVAYIQSTDTNNPATLYKARGTVNCNYVAVWGITATGESQWFAGVNSTDLGNNSGWTFGIPTAQLELYINGTSITDYYVNNSITVNDEITSKINTCSFRTYDLNGEFKPETSQIITIFDYTGNQIFGGTIARVTEKRSGINPSTSGEILQYSVDCQDYTKQLQKKLIVETYLNKSCRTIISEMMTKYFKNEGFTIINVEEGPTISQISFNYKSADKAIEELAKAAGYEWYVDYDKDIHFFSRTTPESKITFTDDTDNWNNLVINPDASQLRNRVYIRGGIYYSDPYEQKMIADGDQEEFILAYTPSIDNFSIVIDSVQRTVGIDNVDDDEDYDFVLNRKEKALKMGETAWAIANKPLLPDTLLTITYNYEIPVLVVQEDTSSISSMKALEGGDGIYEFVVIDKNITSIPAARDRAIAELRDYSNPIVNGTIETYDGEALKSGDLITITSTRRGLDSTYLIQSIKITQITRDQMKYVIKFSGRLYGFVDIIMALFKQSQQIVINVDEVLDAFNFYSDSLDGIQTHTPQLVESAPPFKWSNDAGTTTNKMRWSLFQWS